MNATDSKLLPAPPRLMACLMAGFDAITTHPPLILFPLALDLLLWLGPRLKTERVFGQLIEWMVAWPKVESPETAEMLRMNQEALRTLAERFNLAISLRTYPVGIPSLMSARMPLEAPAGFPLAGLEITSFGVILAGLIVLVLCGYIVSALYFSAVAEASVLGKVRWSYVLRSWPRTAFQSVLLALCWLILIVAISIPASCIILSVNLTSPAFARIVVLLYGGFLIWLLFPLFFSPHGIFINGSNVFVSLRKSMFITRLTLPTTGIFFLAILIISQGMNILWQVPDESSWFTLVGLTGHAFVTTGLLSASFVYYREADRWVQSLRSQLKEMTP